MTSGLRILMVGTDTAFARAVCDVLAAQLPDAASETFDPVRLRARPDAAAVVIDARGDIPGGAAIAERLRAMGFLSGIVLLAAAADSAGSDSGGGSDVARRMGAVRVSPDVIASQLVPKLAELMAAAAAPYADQVMRARRLVAAGEIAMGLQHALNNPIAGIMAEAQLMQFEEVPAEQAQALARVVELCRRLIELTRSLDGIGERNPMRPGAPPGAKG
jgi:signal transduction histidine kinase